MESSGRTVPSLLPSGLALEPTPEDGVLRLWSTGTGAVRVPHRECPTENVRIRIAPIALMFGTKPQLQFLHP